MRAHLEELAAIGGITVQLGETDNALLGRLKARAAELRASDAAQLEATGELDPGDA